MLCFLDTNVCVDLLRGKSRGKQLPPYDRCRLSTVVVAELWAGVYKSADPIRNRASLTALLELFDIETFDEDASHHYGEIRAELEATGTVIGPLDLLIAGHARSKGAVLLTANIKEFQRVSGLQCVAWA